MNRFFEVTVSEIRHMVYRVPATSREDAEALVGTTPEDELLKWLVEGGGIGYGVEQVEEVGWG